MKPFLLKSILASLLAAVLVAALALYVASRATMGPSAIVIGAVLMGLGICVMHYTGMAAMEMQPGIQYDPLLFGASVVIAVAASGAALWIVFNQRRISRNRQSMARLAGASVVVSSGTLLAAIAIAVMRHRGAVQGFLRPSMQRP